jgi:hypothetical protein
MVWATDGSPIVESTCQKLAAAITQLRKNSRYVSTRCFQIQPSARILSTPQVIIDLTIPFDAPKSLKVGFDRKVPKYGHLGPTLPVVIGTLGSWMPFINAVSNSLSIRPNSWRRFRRRSHLLVIQGTMRVVSKPPACSRTLWRSGTVRINNATELFHNVMY